MDRRLFLKLTGVTGLVAATSVLDMLPVSAAGLSQTVTADTAQRLPAVTTTVAPRLALRERGTYQISGVVQLDETRVEIKSGSRSQQISRGGQAGTTAPFSTFHYAGGPGLTPEITVTGGRLVSLNVTPLDLA